MVGRNDILDLAFFFFFGGGGGGGGVGGVGGRCIISYDLV